MSSLRSPRVRGELASIASSELASLASGELQSLPSAESAAARFLAILQQVNFFRETQTFCRKQNIFFACDLSLVRPLTRFHFETHTTFVRKNIVSRTPNYGQYPPLMTPHPPPQNLPSADHPDQPCFGVKCNFAKRHFFPNKTKNIKHRR